MPGQEISFLLRLGTGCSFRTKQATRQNDGTRRGSSWRRAITTSTSSRLLVRVVSPPATEDSSGVSAPSRKRTRVRHHWLVIEICVMFHSRYPQIRISYRLQLLSSTQRRLPTRAVPTSAYPFGPRRNVPGVSSTRAKWATRCHRSTSDAAPSERDVPASAADLPSAPRRSQRTTRPPKTYVPETGEWRDC